MKKLKKKFINGSHLKLWAICAMLIDHLGYFILEYVEKAHTVLFSILGVDVTPYYITRFVGRSAFPIFVFLIVEGFLHTHSRMKYGRNLLIFALISEIPWDLVHSNHLLYEKQNVFFTLFLGYLTLCMITYFKDHFLKQMMVAAIMITTAYFIKSDYSLYGVALIIALYILRSNPMLMTAVGIAILPSKWIGGLAFIPISFYNGERGFIKGNLAKYAFYLFYPVHIFCIYLMKLYLFGT